MKSKEENVLGLFFDNPTRQWHFEGILNEAKITRGKAAKWLKSFIKEEIIRKVKEKGKMPYYTGDCSPAYKNKKKIFAMNNLYNSGFLNHLVDLPKADTVIIFGSFSRSDWYYGSDIDVFIYGNAQGLKLADYEMKLHRDIQVFVCHDKEELMKFGEGLIKNIIKGNIIKGNIDFVKVGANA